MAYVDPTLDDFIERFPNLVNEADGDVPRKINNALNDAKRSVDTSWFEGDYATAILFLAAHFIQSEASFAEGDGAAITSESIGAVSVTYSRTASSTYLASTQYGVRFLELRKRNIPAILSLGTGLA